MVFAPPAVDADPERRKEVLEKLRAETTPRQFMELAVALTVVADKDKRQRGLRSARLTPRLSKLKSIASGLRSSW